MKSVNSGQCSRWLGIGSVYFDIMKLLALDCSTELCSVALYENSRGGEVGTGSVLAGDSVVAAREHTQRLLPMVQQILAATATGLSDLDGIAFGRGPGSFTGLRIALGAVQGLAFGADVPVIPVSTLAVLAQTAIDSGVVETAGEAKIVSAIDARMDEIYWAIYERKGRLVELIGEEYLTAPDGVAARAVGDHEGSATGVGSGWRYARQIPNSESMQQVFPCCQPDAGSLARLAEKVFVDGEAVSADEALPCYLRDEVAWQKVK